MDSMCSALENIDTLFLLNPVVADELNRALLHEAEKPFAPFMPSAMAYDVVGMFRGFQNYGMVGSQNAIKHVRTMLGRPLRTYRAYAEEAANASAADREGRSAARSTTPIPQQMNGGD
jgi:hypothetical protein